MAYLFPYAGQERKPSPPKPTAKVKPRAKASLMVPAESLTPADVSVSYDYDTPEYMPKALRQIFEEVCREHNVTPQQVLARDSRPHIVQARRVFSIRAKAETDYAVSKIARVIGKDHTTIVYFIKQGAAGCSLEPIKDRSVSAPKKNLRLPTSELSPSEKQFDELDKLGLPTVEIARRMGKSRSGVRHYRSRVNLKRKLAAEQANGKT